MLSLNFFFFYRPNPIVINSNFYEVIDTPGLQIGMDQAFSAARLVYGIRKYIEFLLGEKKAPHYLGKDPLCMNQYRYLFTTARIPGETEDKLITLIPSNEIIVIHKKQYYALPLTHEGSPLTSRDLESQIRHILQDVKAYKEPPYSVGLMTAGNRQGKIFSFNLFLF